MTSPATVTIAGPARADFARSQRAIWASLPISLTEDSGEARLIAIDGRSAGWLDVLADVIRPSVAGVMIVRPAAGPSARDIRAVADAAAESGTVVVVETAWASNPPVAELAHAADRQVLDIRLVDSLAKMAGDFPGQWADVLLDHLTLLRAMTGPLAARHFATHSATGYTVCGVTGVRPSQCPPSGPRRPNRTFVWPLTASKPKRTLSCRLAAQPRQPQPGS